MKLVQRFKDVKGIIVNTFAKTESYALSSFSDGTVKLPKPEYIQLDEWLALIVEST